MTTFKEVSQGEFYAAIQDLNVHPQIQPGSYPYTSLFKTPFGQVKGKVVGYYPEGTRLAKNKYYLPL